MTQENGMPVKFELIDKRTGSLVACYDKSSLVRHLYSNKELYALRQAIGATDNSNLFAILNPKQELYLGDLIEFNLDKKNVVGEIVWLNFSVWVRLWRNENWISYLSMSHVLDYFKIKKLGSRYTHPEILKKAGLEEK